MAITGATMTELQGKGITFKDEPSDQGWGAVAHMQLPGGLDVMLYEPRHPTAHSRWRFSAGGRSPTRTCRAAG
jgi:hypothetical protein